MATISLVASHEQSVKNQNHYHNILVSDINSKIVNTLPRYAHISKVLLRVNTKVSSGLPMCELYCYLGNNAGTDSGNTNLGKLSGDLPTSAKDYDWDLSSYFNSAGHDTYPYTMNTSSTYLIPFWLNDYIFSFTITCKVDLIVEYTETGHSYTTETSRTASTCCTKGSVTKQCSCGAAQTTELALDPSNHSGGTELRDVSSASCTSEGYSGDTCCKGCNAKISSGSVIAALGHDYIIDAVTPPTDTASGYTTYTCSRCGDSYADTYIHRIIVKVNDDNGGTVTGGGDYEQGKAVTLTATPASGYKFVKWSDGATTATRTISSEATATYIAVFERIKGNIIVEIAYGSGTVSGLNVGLNEDIEYGQDIVITAIPDRGYKFSIWRVLVNDDDSEGCLVPGDYAENPVTLRVTSEGTSTVYVLFSEVFIDNVLVDNSKVRGVYLNEARDTIIFVTDGTVSQGESLYDTVDGIHFKVQNTFPENAVEVQKIYRDLVKIYG